MTEVEVNVSMRRSFHELCLELCGLILGTELDEEVHDPHVNHVIVKHPMVILIHPLEQVYGILLI